ncbi:CdaR family protein [Enterococcus olivae]
MFNKQRRSNILYALLALLFSFVLFFNANNSTLQGSLLTANEFEETLAEVPVQPIYDTDEFFIQGYQPTVTVTLKSVNRVQLSAETSEETRNFRVVADLSNLGEGTHDVPLQIEDISNSVSATVEPTIFTVTIEKKVTQTFQVETEFSEENLQDGFRLDRIVANPERVSVTTGDQTVKEITKVVADLSSLQEVDGDREEEVPVYAVNESGEILRAVIEPETIQVQMDVSAPEKDIGLYVSQTGIVPNNVSYFEIQLSQTYATISGSQHLLNVLDSIGINVDVTNVTEPTTREIDIPVADGIAIDPKQVTVTINPVLIETTEEQSEDDESTTPSTSEQTVGEETPESSEETEETTEETIESSVNEENDAE